MLREEKKHATPQRKKKRVSMVSRQNIQACPRQEKDNMRVNSVPTGIEAMSKKSNSLLWGM